MSINQDGPVIRTQFAAPEASQAPTANAPEGSFSNSNGVNRYIVGTNTQERVDEKPAPRVFSSPSVGGVVRATIVNGEAVEERGESISRSHSGELTSHENGAPRFTSSGGVPLMPNQIRPDSLVTVSGVTTSVMAAMNAGLLRHENGNYVNASGAAASTSEKTDAQKLEEALSQQRAEKEQAEKANAPKVEPLDDASEAIMSEVTQKVGNLDASAAVAAVIDTGDLTSDITARIATSLGVSMDEVGKRAETLKASFTKQASDAVGPGAETIFAWAREHQAEALRQAMLTHANQGTTAAYRDIAMNYMASLGDTKAGREMIRNATNAAAFGVTVDDRKGKAFVTLPRVGKVEWSVAVRQGLIPMPKRNW